MLRRPRTPMVPLRRTTRQAILARSFWVLPPERFWLMELVIGGRPTATAVSIIPGRRHIVAPTTDTVIITARLTMTTTPERMVGMGARTVRTEARAGGQAIILTPARTHEAGLSQPLTAPEVQHKPIIHTQGPTPRRDKVQARQRNGEAPMCREGTRVRPLATIPLPMVP